MKKEYGNILDRWFEEVWNDGRAEAIDELAAPDIVSHGLVDARGNDIAGREAFKAFWRQFRGAFPDVHVDVEDAINEGDKVMVRCTVRGTHTGEGMGPATGKKITFTGMCLARVKVGQFVEVWNSFDFLALYQQLDLVPATFA
jgi:steroid delta-isomerase-like uncharacterized protein